MRRAEWKRSPNDPRSVLAWWWRDVWYVALILAAVSLGAIPGLLVAAILASAPFLIVPIPFIVIGIVGLSARLRASLPEVQRLAPLPAPIETFPVEYVLYAGEVPTGRDQGIASFVDGWMVVEGLRTSFSLRPADLARSGKPRGGFDRFRVIGGGEFEIRSLSSSSKERDAFGGRMREWHHFTLDAPTGESILPPSDVHPSAASNALSTLMIHLLFAVPTVATLLFFRQMPGTATFLLVIGIFAVFAFRDGAQAVRELIRIRSLTRRAVPQALEPTSL